MVLPGGQSSVSPQGCRELWLICHLPPLGKRVCFLKNNNNNSSPPEVFSGWAVSQCDIMLSLPSELTVTWLQGANFLIVFPTAFAFAAWAKHCKIQMEVYSLFCIRLTEADMAKDFIVIEKANRS